MNSRGLQWLDSIHALGPNNWIIRKAFMADFGYAILIILFFELISLPLRFLLVWNGLEGNVCRVLSRLAGSLLILFPIWALAHLDGIFLSRAFGWAWISLAIASIWWFLLRGRNYGILRWLGYEQTGNYRGIHVRDVCIDLTTMALFLGFICFRRMVPEMTFQVSASGAEKFANAMFFWSTWHAEQLPPDDYWFSGHALHYYYWGHFHWSWVTRIGFIPADLSINLAFARMVTLIWEACWLLAHSLRVRNSWSYIGAFAICWGGNPHAMTDLFKTLQSPGQFSWTHYPFWGPSRAISDIVDEFPAFSAILGDFHAHHLALPWFIAWLAVTTAGYRWLIHGKLLRIERIYPLLLLFATWVGLGLAACLSNMWNLPLTLFVLLLFLMVQFMLNPRRGPVALGAVFVFVLVLGGSIHLMMSEATSALSRSPGVGIASVPLKVLDSQFRTQSRELFMMWGFPIVWGMLFSTCLMLAKRSWATIVPWIAGQVMIMTGWHAGTGLAATLTWSGCGMLMCMILISTSRHKRIMILAYIGGILAVLIGVEWLYITDRFDNSTLRRYNSYFKLTYPAWPVLIILMILAAQSSVRSVQHRPFAMMMAMIPATCFLCVMMIYPVRAIPARIGQARIGDLQERKPTLNSWDFIKHRTDKGNLDYRSELPLLKYVRAHVPPGDPVLEAAIPARGGSKAWPGGYDYGGRVASLAGRPTLMGWQHHEHQWRGQTAYNSTRRRTSEIDAFYRADDVDSMRMRAHRLGVPWVLFGVIEFERYGSGSVEIMKKAATKAVFSTPGIRGKNYYLFDFRPAEFDK